MNAVGDDQARFDELEVETGVHGRTLRLWSWMESHSADYPTPGPHLAIHGLPQKKGGEAQSLVIHLEHVPALVAALTRAAANLAVTWDRHGEQYWAEAAINASAETL